MGHSKEKLEHQSLVTVRQTSILHSDFRGSIERVVLLCRKIVSSFVLLHIFISFLCCLAEKGQGEVSKRLKIAEKLQSVYLKIDKKTLFFLIYPKIVNRKEFMVTYPPSKRIFSSKVLFANVCIISFLQQSPHPWSHFQREIKFLAKKR